LEIAWRDAGSRSNGPEMNRDGRHPQKLDIFRIVVFERLTKSDKKVAELIVDRV